MSCAWPSSSNSVSQKSLLAFRYQAFWLPSVAALGSKALLIADVDDVGARVEVEAPHMLEDLRPGEHLARCAHQVFEQAELARRQLGAATAAPVAGLARDAVELELAHLHGVLPVARQSATHRVNARDEFLDEKRFGEVVVGTLFEPFDAIAGFVARRQQDDGRRHTRPAQPLRHRQTIAARQHDVEHDRIEGIVPTALEAGVAVAAVGHREAARREARANEVGDLLFVVDEQDVHGPTARKASRLLARRRAGWRIALAGRSRGSRVERLRPFRAEAGIGDRRI